MWGIDRTIGARIVFTFTFILCVLNFSFWEMVKDMTGVTIWYYLNALCFVGYIFAYWLLRHDLWSDIALGVAISSFLDECFFDPTKIEMNEYIGFSLIVLIAIYNDRKGKGKDTGTHR